jgi:hypothetical protein
MVLKLRVNQRSTACNFLDSSENTLSPFHPGKILTNFIMGKTTRKKREKRENFKGKRRKRKDEGKMEVKK